MHLVDYGHLLAGYVLSALGDHEDAEAHLLMFIEECRDHPFEGWAYYLLARNEVAVRARQCQSRFADYTRLGRESSERLRMPALANRIRELEKLLVHSS